MDKMYVLLGKCKFQKLTQEVEKINMYLKKITRHRWFHGWFSVFKQQSS